MFLLLISSFIFSSHDPKFSHHTYCITRTLSIQLFLHALCSRCIFSDTATPTKRTLILSTLGLVLVSAGDITKYRESINNINIYTAIHSQHVLIKGPARRLIGYHLPMHHHRIPPQPTHHPHPVRSSTDTSHKCARELP